MGAGERTQNEQKNGQKGTGWSRGSAPEGVMQHLIIIITIISPLNRRQPEDPDW